MALQGDVAGVFSLVVESPSSSAFDTESAAENFFGVVASSSEMECAPFGLFASSSSCFVLLAAFEGGVLSPSSSAGTGWKLIC